MILLSPYSRPLRNGERNPKNFPHWRAVLTGLGGWIVQIGVEGEEALTTDFRRNLSLKAIKDLLQECDSWISVDNFLPHLAHHLPKPGVVLWSVSDPLIFGYPENLNLLKDRRYLRKGQFDIWESTPWTPEAFLSPEDVLAALYQWGRVRDPIREEVGVS